jgi:hypothetical protein
MRTIRFFALASLVPSALLLTAACDVSDIGDDLGQVALRPYGCSVCGGGLGNSPVVNGASLREFSLDGTLNKDGVRIVGGEFPGDKHRFSLVVDPAEEQWVGVKDSQTSFTGVELAGSRLILEVGGVEVSVELTAVEKVPSWSNSGSTETVYRALYKDVNGQQASLCPSLNLDEQWFTLLSGETYHDDNTIGADQGAWVTIACMGQAAAKMKMLGYGPNGTRGATLDERRTTLRMITADYCGTGHSFTASGVHVAWRDAAMTVEPPFEEAEIEAKWGPNGATCLKTPRLVDRKDVDDVCDIPTCADESFEDNTVWRTMLP